MTLELTIHNATGVPKMDVVGHCDPYCTVEYSASGKGKAEWKTNVAGDGKNPAWQHKIEVQAKPGVDAFFLVKMYDEDTAVDEYIGSFTIPTNEPLVRQKFLLQSEKTKSCFVYVSLKVPKLETAAPLPAEQHVSLANQVHDTPAEPSAPEEQQQCPAIDAYPISYSPNKGTMALWIAAFANCDGNKSGTVSQKELIKFFRHAEGGSESDYKQRTREFFKKADGNRSGTLEIPEFIRWMVEGTVTPDMIHEIGSLSPDLIRITLRSIDSNNDGNLTVKEIQRFFHGFGMKFKDGVLKNKFSFAEFVELLQRFDSSMVTLV